MSDVLEELADETDGKLDASHVERRVRDWAARINGLYDDVRRWLPAGFSTEIGQTVTMREKMMSKYGIADQPLPVLSITRNGESFGRLVPNGLWIIGANGRVDLFTEAGHWIIVDRAENFARSDWVIAPSEARRDLRALGRDTFLQAIGL